jgi:hypothetical protein
MANIIGLWQLKNHPPNYTIAEAVNSRNNSEVLLMVPGGVVFII